MRDSEDLLRHHGKRRCICRAIQKQLEQCRRDLATMDSIIAQRVLKRNPPDLGGVSGGPRSCSPTEALVLAIEAEKVKTMEAIRVLVKKGRSIRVCLNLFEAVYAGLDEQERWLVEGLFLQNRSLGDLLPEAEASWGICSKSTLHRKKERMIEKVDLLIQSMSAPVIK